MTPGHTDSTWLVGPDAIGNPQIASFGNAEQCVNDLDVSCMEGNVLVRACAINWLVRVGDLAVCTPWMVVVLCVAQLIYDFRLPAFMLFNAAFLRTCGPPPPISWYKWLCPCQKPGANSHVTVANHWKYDAENNQIISLFCTHNATKLCVTASGTLVNAVQF